jgi:calcineurin-like phosphoesterase family protein
LSDYTPYFRDIRACHVMDNCILTHIPIHDSAKGRFRANIHGHTHNNVLSDSWYVNVCVEHTEYSPVAWETIRKKIGDAQ